MPASTRFAAAAHIMALLAAGRSRPQTSEALAKSLATNPAVARRILGALAKAGLTQSALGEGGGARLAKGPKKITLGDIYRAVETPGLLPMPRAAPAADDAARPAPSRTRAAESEAPCLSWRVPSRMIV